MKEERAIAPNRIMIITQLICYIRLIDNRQREAHMKFVSKSMSTFFLLKHCWIFKWMNFWTLLLSLYRFVCWHVLSGIWLFSFLFYVIFVDDKVGGKSMNTCSICSSHTNSARCRMFNNCSFHCAYCILVAVLKFNIQQLW